MKKIIALLAVSVFALAFVACGKKAETAETPAETPATEEVVVDSAAVDSASVAVDSAAAQ